MSAVSQDRPASSDAGFQLFCTQVHELTRTEKNLALQDELLALRDATAQSYSHAEALKAHWAEIDKAQQGLYQVCQTSIQL